MFARLARPSLSELSKENPDGLNRSGFLYFGNCMLRSPVMNTTRRLYQPQQAANGRSLYMMGSSTSVMSSKSVESGV